MNAIGSPPTGYAVRSIRAGKWKYIMNLNHKVTVQKCPHAKRQGKLLGLMGAYRQD